MCVTRPGPSRSHNVTRSPGAIVRIAAPFRPSAAVPPPPRAPVTFSNVTARQSRDGSINAGSPNIPNMGGDITATHEPSGQPPRWSTDRVPGERRGGIRKDALGLREIRLLATPTAGRRYEPGSERLGIGHDRLQRVAQSIVARARRRRCSRRASRSPAASSSRSCRGASLRLAPHQEVERHRDRFP